ncbi:hypothetical protein K2173_007890 [Erythroxylum novogranatense]|uniref:ACB domain-containing protein n=1 Tax=Erythroxylum novogranatense TaxID=1862640 RepID=A0AAV8T7T3_9ROSI|nr:hypothetical protein K2173_007890 [Erythroxylum novogranatense]
MELVQELIVTALVAVLVSFLIAKLVSLAMSADSDHVSDNTHVDSDTISDDLVAEELQFYEKLQVPGSIAETKAVLLEESAIIPAMDDFVAESGPVEKSAMNLDDPDEVVRNDCSGGIVFEGKRVVVENLESDKSATEQSQSSNGKEEGGEESKEIKEIQLDDSALQSQGIGPITESFQATGIVQKGEEITVIEEKKVEIEIDDADDDWEGIERSELEKTFGEAVKFMENNGKVTSDVQMELYGLHKIATEGSCHEQPPMALKVSARAKWNAWQRLGNMNPEMAMEQYIALVSNKVPDWIEHKQHIGDERPESFISANTSVSIPSTVSSHQPNITCDGNPEVKLGAERSSFESKVEE